MRLVIGTLMLFAGMATVESERFWVPVLLLVVGGLLMLWGSKDAEREQEMDCFDNPDDSSRPYFLH